MKAILSIPAKFLAVFSNRVKMRRLSFSQPISRSMMFRWLSKCYSVEHDRSGVAVLILPGRNHRLDFQLQQALADPVDSAPFAFGQSDRPSNGFTFAVVNRGIRRIKQGNQCG